MDMALDGKVVIDAMATPRCVKRLRRYLLSPVLIMGKG
jgi:hypothetical protein